MSSLPLIHCCRTQYRGGIYYHTPEQLLTAQVIPPSPPPSFSFIFLKNNPPIAVVGFGSGQASMADEQKKHTAPLATELLPATKFWLAEDYHQQYLEKGGQSAKKTAEEKIRCYG